MDLQNLLQFYLVFTILAFDASANGFVTREMRKYKAYPGCVLNVSAMLRGAVEARSAVSVLFEDLVKIGDRGKSYVCRYIENALIRRGEKLFRLAYPDEIKVFREGGAHCGLENSAEVASVKAEHGADVIEAYVFRIPFVYSHKSRQHFLYRRRGEHLFTVGENFFSVKHSYYPQHD